MVKIKNLVLHMGGWVGARGGGDGGGYSCSTNYSRAIDQSVHLE